VIRCPRRAKLSTCCSQTTNSPSIITPRR
jgi:hypothetical protein